MVENTIIKTLERRKKKKEEDEEERRKKESPPVSNEDFVKSSPNLSPNPSTNNLNITPQIKPNRDGNILTDVKTGQPTGIVKDGEFFMGNLSTDEQKSLIDSRLMQEQLKTQTNSLNTLTDLSPIEQIRQNPQSFGLETPEQAEQQQAEISQEGDYIDMLVKQKYPDIPVRQEGETTQEWIRRYNDWRMKNLGGLYNPRDEFINTFSQENLEKSLKSVGMGYLTAGMPAVFSLFGINGYKLAGSSQVIRNPQVAIQSGNAIKTSNTIKGIFGNLVNWAGGLYVLEKVYSYLSPNKVSEQQQAINTLGQITSTIVGDSMNGASDWKKGLSELNNIESQLLELEKDIKLAGIRHFQVRYNGQIIDLNADIQDALKTIQEGKRDIQTFVLQGNFPELSPWETQIILRELESEGILEPVSFEATNRPVTEAELSAR